MKILIIIDDLRSGGTENVLASRISALKSDIDIHIFTLFDLGPVAERLKSMGIEVDFLDIKNYGVIKTFNYLENILKEEKFDAAVCMRNVSRALFPKFLKKYIAKVAMLWDSPIIRRSWKYSILEWYQVKFSDAVPYCSSKNIAAALQKIYGFKNIKIIPNCYDQNIFKKRKNYIKRSDILQIITVGGAREEKNYLHQLAIAQSLKDNEIKFKLTIAGDDPDGYLYRDILEQNLENEVLLLGNRKDVHKLLAQSDIFISTSFSEGFPVALLEAMAVGVPCVSYKFPSLCEIDEKFANIAVVPQGSVKEAVEKIIYLAENPDKYAKLAENAAEHVSEKFTADKNSKLWVKFLSNNGHKI